MNRDGTLSFTRGGCLSCLCACFGARLLLQSYQYPNLSEGADSVGGQLHGDKECPFSGVTSSGRVCRKVPKSDARSVCHCLCGLPAAVLRRGQRPPKGSGTNDDCRSNLEPKHARKHETHPPRVKERVPSRLKRLCFFVLV